MQRAQFISEINQAMRVNPVIALLGPRQCGKTTLAKHFIQNKQVNYFDLENPQDLARLDAPMLALDHPADMVVIDEIQRKPDLFPILRVIVDATNRRKKFLILGSASRELIQQSSESLAGRISYLELTPFLPQETHDVPKNWLRGGFPNSFLAATDEISFAWRENYIKTFLEQDIPNLGIRVAPQMLRRFWMMLAHYHGNLLNNSELGKSLSVAHTTIKSYVDILSGTFMIRTLQPWFENISKRQVKTSKIYFRDSGILHNLLNINNQVTLERHPKLGSSWEGFALEAIIQHYHAAPENCFFWAVHNQAELDLLIFHQGKRLGFEFKYSDAPTLTQSIKTAYDTLQLNQLLVIYPGKKSYLLSEKNIRVVSLTEFLRSH